MVLDGTRSASDPNVSKNSTGCPRDFPRADCGEHLVGAGLRHLYTSRPKERPTKVDERIDNLPRLDGVRALVVDDSAVIRALLQTTLEKCGAAVTAVGAADAALQVVVHERPDVIVSDLQMPNKGGYWLIGQVRALSPEHGGVTPAVALTGLVGPEHRASALRAGFQYHLEKPVDLHALVGVVASLAYKEPDRRPSLVALPPTA